MPRALDEWTGRTPDTQPPPRVKDRVSAKAEDCCQKCGRRVGGRLRPEFDHVIPLIIGGKNCESNLQLLCQECHGAKTALDVKLKAKVARVRQRHIGVKKKRTITRWRKFSGEIVTAPRIR